MTRAGVFCLETGDWWGRLIDHSSIEPFLQVLGQPGLLPVPSVYRTVMTQEEFERYIHEWRKPKNNGLPILYLCFHGQTNGVDFEWTSRRVPEVNLRELAEIIGDKCQGRIIHLGTCQGMKDQAEVARFLKKTRALGFSGYVGTVGWMKSAALDLLYFYALGENGVTAQGLEATRTSLEKDMGGMVKRFGFQIHIAPPGSIGRRRPVKPKPKKPRKKIRNTKTQRN